MDGILASWMVALSLVTLGQVPADSGVLHGRVVNGSRKAAPCAGAEVVLRAGLEGKFVTVARTVADAAGRYEFSELPVGMEHVFLAGANHDEIHYPGRRVRLSDQEPTAEVPLTVFDSVREPSPLVVRKHEIVIDPQPGAVHVVEAMLIDNPSQTTYVGLARAEAALAPITLRLGIPGNFEQVTFEEERLGREFNAVDGRLVTSLPWLPGPRWVRFTYSLRQEQAKLVWQRTIDAPCESVRLRVRHRQPDEVRCNLPRATESLAGEQEFAWAGGVLPAGHVIEIHVGEIPRTWATHARWGAVGLLALGIIVVVGRLRRAKQPVAAQTSTMVEASQHSSLHGPHAQRLHDAARRRRQRARR